MSFLIYVQEEERSFKNFINSLRCPLCGSQLDGNIHSKEARLYCVSNNDEYKATWIFGEDTPLYESISYWYPQYQYIIFITKFNDNHYNTIIEQFNMDADPLVRHRTRKKIFEYSGTRLLFFRSRMEEDVFLKRLKIYNVFS